MRPSVFRFVAAVLAVLTSATIAGVFVPVSSDENRLRKVGEYRPFGANKMGNLAHASAVDVARRTWFFAVSSDPATGGIAPVHIWQFDLDKGPKMVGPPVVLPGAETNIPTFGLDADRGIFFILYRRGAGTEGQRIAAVTSTPSGPKLVADYLVGDRLTATKNTGRLTAKGLDTHAGKLYLGAFAEGVVGETAVLRLDIARLLSGGDPFDWRFNPQRCPSMPGYNGPAGLGRSRMGNQLVIPCSAKGKTDLQGVEIVDMPDPENTATFKESLFPIGGDFSQGESFFDAKANRIALRRTGPAELVTFDVTHRRWLPRVQFGQNNLYQWAVDPESGRIYGLGNDPAAGANREYLYVPEVRTTPPQNGATLEAVTATAGSELVPKGVEAFDPITRRAYIADFDSGTVTDPTTGITRQEAAGVFFHVYEDPRPVGTGRTVPNPDKDIINYSGEAQGYGARISYVGGFGNSYSNAVNPAYPIGTVLAPGSRHITYARTNQLRVSEGEASAEAIGAHPDGSMAAELTTLEQPWPYQPANCSDFSGEDKQAATSGATVSCALGKHEARSAAVYEANSDNPYNAPIQRAHTAASITLDPKKGIVTEVLSEASVDIPGLVHIGRVWAKGVTSAAGKPGAATKTYERGMDDVTIAGQPFCAQNCDMQAVADKINREFAHTTSAGIQIVATVPNPDPELLPSPGGAQSALQRDFWDHQEDMLLHEAAADRFEMPAFVIAAYQDRRFPEHEVYWLAGIQAGSRFPQRLADKLQEIFDNQDHSTSAPLTVAVSPVSSGPDNPDAMTPPGTGNGSGNPRVGRGGRPLRLTERLAWTLRSPFHSGAILALFAFLLSPVYLSSRRSHFMNLRSNAGDQ